MRSLCCFLILAGLAGGMGGCRTDRGSRASSEIGARASGAPAVEAPPAEPASGGELLPKRPDEADHRPVLVCFGDSLTAGYGTDPGESYPDFLQTALDLGGYGYRVVNEGISGNTTKDGLERLGAVLALKPEIVVVEFGGNDGLRGLPIADTRANLDAMIAKLKAAKVKVALAGITLPPDYGADYLRQFDAMYTTLAAKYKVPMIPFLLKNVYGVDGMMQTDRTHATALGNRVVARNVLELVTPLLKR